MQRFLYAIAALLLFSIPAYAQSTATPVVTGYLSASGCPGNQNPCFIQYGSSGGSGGTVTANQGTAGASAWPVKGAGTAGTADTGVLTVQGIASGTNVPVSQGTAANLNATVVGTGTFAVQAAESGTWTVQPGNTANTAPWLANASNTRMATYAVDAIGYTAYATPTDMIGICGSGTKTIVITFMSMRIQSTAAALQNLYFIKRSTADTGGTATNPAGVPYDSTNAAATATVSVYTVVPGALGTAIGTLRVNEATSAVLTGTPTNSSLITNGPSAGNALTPSQPITLRGTGECLYMNYNGAALTSGFTAGYTIEWEEF